MKNFRTLFVVCLLAMATAVNAQLANTSSVDNKGWQGVKLSYNRFTIDEKGLDYDAISAFEVGYAKAFSISQAQPLFVEAGASFAYATGDFYNEDGVSFSLKMASLFVPVNLGYKVSFSNGMSLFPYVGVSLKGHITGEIEADMNIYDSYEGRTYSVSTTLDVFDDDDMEDTWKRFQIG